MIKVISNYYIYNFIDRSIDKFCSIIVTLYHSWLFLYKHSHVTVYYVDVDS